MKYIILYPIYLFLKLNYYIWNGEHLYNSFKEYIEDFKKDDDDHDCFTI